jgi:hypothetical protein
MKPPLPNDLLLLLLPNNIIAVKKPTTIPNEMKVWLLKKWRTERKKPVKAPVVDFGAILGGLTVTLLMVSRIEARDSRIGSPDAVISQ